MSGVKYKSGTGFLLATLGRRVESLWSIFLKEHDITTAEFTALAVLDAQGPRTQRQLAKDCEVDPRNIVATIKKLQTRGCVTTATDLNDGRAKILHATLSGHEMLQHLYTDLRPVEDTFMRSISINGKQHLQELLMTLKKDSD